MASKVQSAKNVLEGDKHVANVQQMLMSASYPLLNLWSKIISQEEDFEFEAEEFLKDIQQSLCAIESSFQGLNTGVTSEWGPRGNPLAGATIATSCHQ